MPARAHLVRSGLARLAAAAVWLAAASLAGRAAGAAPLVASATAPTREPAPPALFADRCVSCHSLAGVTGEDLLAAARGAGPSLAYAGSKFQRSWLAAWLATPSRLRPAGYLPFRYTVATADGDRIAAERLPVHPRLEPAAAQSVADFLMTLRRPLQPYPVANSPSTLRAEVHFHKILPCGSCHQARPGQGGISGPELYTAGRRLQREWLLSFIADPQYWSVPWMPKSDVRSDQLAAIASYLLQVEAAAPGATAGTAVAASGAAPPDPVLPAERPRATYLLLCAQCHGIQGNGKGINAASMFIAPRDHTSFDVMSQLTRDRLELAIKNGGPAVGKSALMPSWGAVLRAPDIEGLVAYLRRLSGTEVP